MKRRLMCALLMLVMLVGLIPATALNASAASTMTTSEKGIAVIKGFEGFRAYAYLDNGGYSIGYGTRCEQNDYPNGITAEKADQLLRNMLSSMEAYLNKMIDKYSLSLTQNEFDALMVFTYNLGAAWTLSDSDFRSAVIGGMSGNDFIYYISRWCNDSSGLQTGLIKRRLAEANMYLNGYYSTKEPENYTYVLFNLNGGSSVDSKVQAYDACTPVEVRTTPSYTGYKFLGWYTEPTGGKLVTHLDNTTKGITLYAHWQKIDAEATDAVTASYTRIAANALSVYDAPSKDATASKTVEKDAEISVVADYVDAEGTLWCKLTEGGWVKRAETTVKTTAASAHVNQAPEVSVSETTPSEPETTPTEPETTPTEPETTPTEPETTPETTPTEPDNSSSAPETSVIVTLTGSAVNFRTGPGTNYKALGSLRHGHRITVTEVQTVNGVKWGKFNLGWMCLTYTNYDLVTAKKDDTTTDKKDDTTTDKKDDTTSATVIATGTVKNCGSLRYRSAAGMNSKTLGTIPGGTRVEILEMNAEKTWGRISLGWISLSYVALDSTTTTPTTPSTPDTSTPDSSKPAETPSTSTSVSGWVTAGALNVREGAGTNYKAVTLIPRDRKVTITEQKTVGGKTWGKMELGWVCMDYIRLDKSTTGTTGSTGTTGNTGSSNTGTGNTGSTGTTTTGSVTGIVTATNLCVRAGAGTNYAVKSTLPNGTSVTVTEQKYVNNLVWGKTEGGWICMSYVKLNTTNTSVGFTGTVTASSLCVRKSASTSSGIVAGYTKGQTVTIFETKNVSGTTWGRTADGWVCMKYIK